MAFAGLACVSLLDIFIGVATLFLLAPRALAAFFDSDSPLWVVDNDLAGVEVEGLI